MVQETDPIGTSQFPLTAHLGFGDHSLPGFVYCDVKRNNGGEDETAVGSVLRCQ